MRAFLLAIFSFILSLFSIQPSPSPAQVAQLPAGTSIPSPSPSPTPKPLTFAEMNALYGPCVNLPTLMYHHIQPADQAAAKSQTGLTVTPETFRTQLEYLRSKSYNPITPTQLAAFFSAGTPLPAQSVLLTFDDAYADFASFAAPILQELGFPATVFVPTGLLENPDYMSWSDLSRLSGNFHFGNHTWSHKNVAATMEVIQNEISLADTQLSDRGFNSPKIFAYPYGLANANAQKVLTDLGYQLAFTTQPGRVLCTKQRLALPRIRIGNSPLTNYGL
jgi:peptidoglycan/xylan/chitin deacetylase (PgdA/CDA1 family)